MREGNRADFAVFERDGVAGVHFAADPVEAEQLAGHLETGDLIATVLDQHVGLEKAAANGVDRLEALPGTVQMIAALQAPARRNQFVELLQFLRSRPIGRHSSRRLQFEQAVFTTSNASLAVAALSDIGSFFSLNPAFDPRQPGCFSVVR
jgi:hypothetical protein